MERHFQYYVPFTNDTQHRASVRKHNWRASEASEPLSYHVN